MWGSLRAAKRLLSSTPASLLAPTAAVAVAGESYRRRTLCEDAYKEELPSLLQQAEEERKKAEELKNPGGFEKLLEEGKKLVTPDIFEGFRLEIQKMVTPHFYIGHNFSLGQQIPNTNINASYDFSTHTILQPGNQLLMARVSQMGSVDGRYHFSVGDRLLLKLVASLQPNPSKDVYQLEAEYAGDTAHFSIRGSKGPTVYASYMQSVTPRIAVGGDSLFDLNEGAGIFSFGGRYSGPDYAIVGMLGQLCVLQYIRHVNPNRMSLVADLMVNPMTLDGQAVLGAEVIMKQSRFLTTVDNDGRLAASIDAKVVPNAVNMLLSAEIMHTKNEYKFGYGFQINL